MKPGLKTGMASCLATYQTIPWLRALQRWGRTQDFTEQGVRATGVQPDFCRKMYDLIKAQPLSAQASSGR